MDARISIKGKDLILECSKLIDLGPIREILNYDENFKFYRTFPFHYKKVIEYLGPRYDIEDEISSWINEKLTLNLKQDFELREYQTEALNTWVRSDYHGIITLPTGSGKTFIALAAITHLKLKTLIIVPTINLLEQWKHNISKFLMVSEDDVGIYGGGKKEKKEITITTYDSAYIHFNDFVDFGLLVFDEVHHLAAPNYRKIAQGIPTPKRMGLTATRERPDELHLMLDSLVGKEIFKLTPEDLKGYISPFELKKIYVELSEDEREKYKILREKYINYCRRRHIRFYSAKDFQKLVWLSFRDKNAKEALDAHRISRQLAFNADKKIMKIDELLKQHKNDKVVIFSEFNKIVNIISQQFFLPSITYKTKLDERREILEKFKTGKYTKIVTSKVLDEGWDVKDANVGIVVSGTGTKRQLIQRLGRLLRKKEGKTAVLYEVVTKGTMEVDTARRRVF